MSAPAIGWVFEHSPLRGSELLVHLAIADTVNEAYGHTFWASLSTLADKARVNRNTAREAVRKLEALELLELVSAERGKPCKYRFLMPDPAAETRPAGETRCASETADPAPQTANVAPEPRSPRATAAPNPNEREQPNGTQTDETFAAFWERYPRRHNGGRGARKEALNEWRKLDDDQRTLAFERLDAYAAQSNGYSRDASRYLKHHLFEDVDPNYVPKPRRSEKTERNASVRAGFLELLQPEHERKAVGA